MYNKDHITKSTGPLQDRRYDLPSRIEAVVYIVPHERLEDRKPLPGSSGGRANTAGTIFLRQRCQQRLEHLNQGTQMRFVVSPAIDGA